MNAPSLRAALPPVPAVPATSAAGSNAGTPTPPDRVPTRTAPARPFADMLRQHRAEASPSGPPSSAGVPTAAADAANEDTAPAEPSTDRPGTPTKTKARAPARSPAAADKAIRDSNGLAETRALDERSAEPGPERPLPAADAGAVRPLPVVEDKAAAASNAASERGADADETASSALDLAAGSDASSRRPGRSFAGDARAEGRGEAARSAGVEPAPSASPTPLAAADSSRLQQVAVARPSFDLALHAASAASALSAPVASGESMRPDAATPAFVLPTPVDSPEFAGALGVQVSLLARDGVQRAELHLNPAEMGPVSIRIQLDGTDAQVQFGADLAETRQAIESGLPELASALREAGFTLAGGGVSQHAGGRERDDASRRSPSADPMRERDLQASGGGAVPVIRRVAAGGVDLYA